MIDPVAFGARTVPRSVLQPLACSLVLVVVFAAPALAGAGTLSPDDEQLASGEYFDRVTFSGAAGDEVRVEHSSREFQPYLLIRDPDGEPFLEDDGSSGAGVQVVFRLPASGTYTAVITNWAPGETGGYRLVLSDPNQRSGGISKTPSSAEPAASGTAQTHSVRGSVVDAQGSPLAGARITLQPALTLGQVNVTADADGECVAESLPDVSYQARAWALVNYGGQEICMRLGMESDSDYNSFSAAGGAVRNFGMQLTGAIGDMQSAVDGHFG